MIRRIVFNGLVWMVCSAVATGDSAFDAPGNFNPIVPGYFADPTLQQFGDLFYLYATTGGDHHSEHEMAQPQPVNPSLGVCGTGSRLDFPHAHDGQRCRFNSTMSLATCSGVWPRRQFYGCKPTAAFHRPLEEGQLHETCGPPVCATVGRYAEFGSGLR